MPKTFFSAAVLAICFLSGCAKPAPPDAASTSKVAADGHDHSGWWCAEHGVPEEVCARCKISLVAAFKEKGDWCQEHERPDSQCFVCHPEKQAEFAAQYEAKYGRQPPKPDDAGEKHDHKHESKS